MTRRQRTQSDSTQINTRAALNLNVIPLSCPIWSKFILSRIWQKNSLNFISLRIKTDDVVSFSKQLFCVNYFQFRITIKFSK